jgi:hypothetical protein
VNGTGEMQQPHNTVYLEGSLCGPQRSGLVGVHVVGSLHPGGSRNRAITTVPASNPIFSVKSVSSKSATIRCTPLGTPIVRGQRGLGDLAE